ncbi:hypothetical protein TRFO_01092 [Tritrichomonas foetus]|uniref:Uncharacterized protein n=1 Tax=Tritrichomonas foetus TaxID=1144522 RepID=A0A1J4KIW9_9EUKA|nr:hypothetical protein TRFO_01092 [Tritrichomonas foetus]|eukprot:OHT11179.1 hypothetical protein TRFO_01092 [Tritrichomonas foetus]
MKSYIPLSTPDAINLTCPNFSIMCDDAIPFSIMDDQMILEHQRIDVYAPTLKVTGSLVNGEDKEYATKEYVDQQAGGGGVDPSQFVTQTEFAKMKKNFYPDAINPQIRSDQYIQVQGREIYINAQYGSITMTTTTVKVDGKLQTYEGDEYITKSYVTKLEERIASLETKIQEYHKKSEFETAIAQYLKKTDLDAAMQEVFNKSTEESCYNIKHLKTDDLEAGRYAEVGSSLTVGKDIEVTEDVRVTGSLYVNDNANFEKDVVAVGEVSGDSVFGNSVTGGRSIGTLRDGYLSTWTATFYGDVEAEANIYYAGTCEQR